MAAIAYGKGLAEEALWPGGMATAFALWEATAHCAGAAPLSKATVSHARHIAICTGGHKYSPRLVLSWRSARASGWRCTVKARQRATFFGLFVALILPFLLDLAIGKRTSDLASQTRVIVAIAEEWGLVALLLGVILFWERQALATIGIKRMSGRDVAAGILGFLLGALSFVLTTPLIGFLGLETTSTGISKLAQVPVALRVAVVLTAGITEEILFRGYPIERITALTGKLSWGATIAYVVFVLLHIPFWGLGGTIQIGVWTLIVTVLYARRRNLLACMLMHILNDAYAFVLLPLLLPQYVL